MTNRPLLWSLLAIALASSATTAQDLSITQSAPPPKREFRAAWIATVTNLDWPSAPALSADVQKAQLTTMLDNLKALGINAVIFQVRSECDAMYQSSIDPWSYWLTGSQGVPPSPYYDPLAFAVDEAHKRGMELHAWFNPYRAVRNVSGTYTIANNHVSKQHPDWVIQINNLKFLDPGLPAVRDYVTSVVLDIVRRYDVDGVHADDYFYPYSPDNITTQDANTFLVYPRSFGPDQLADWRRDNVNLLIKAIHDSIQVVKPWVRFGMSPFGIWQPGYPSGISGMNAYTEIFCDAPNWLANGYIDYLAPQLYWKITGSQDYSKLMPWWATKLNGRHLYPGQAPYRIVTSSWSFSELPNQVRLNRTNAGSNVLGSVFFRAGNGLIDNVGGFGDSLRTDLYRSMAIPPAMSWKDNVAPNPPSNLRFVPISGNQYGLRWDGPTPATDGDTARRYVIYRMPHGTPPDITDPSTIIAVSPSSTSVPPTASTSGADFVVTSLDRTNNESPASGVLYVPPPAAPDPKAPLNNIATLRDTAVFKWGLVAGASSYQLQVASDAGFTQILLSNSFADTTAFLAGLAGQVPYYWRVCAANPGGTGGYSPAWTFQSGKPLVPTLTSPANSTLNVPVNVVLSWAPAPGAATYHVQVAPTVAWTSFMADVSGIADTTLTLNGLVNNKVHNWRVQSTNSYGTSSWSAPFAFKTVAATSVLDAEHNPAGFGLAQNYPNPFNPRTTISFTLDRPSEVELAVYDLLGRRIALLMSGEHQVGTYEAFFNGSNLPTGIYFYRLVAEGKVETRKMLLLK